MNYANPVNQAIAGNAAATAREPTAAQSALQASESVKERALSLTGRLNGICNNLGISRPPTDQKEAPRPVRSGIIGSIHETTTDVGSIIDACHDLVSQIERQV